MNFETVGRLLVSQDWIFAKTMADNPHWYTLRKNWKADGSFSAVVEYIRKNSYVEHFKGRPYRCFNLNGFKYWTMGAPINETILINRSKIKPKAPYNDIADKYVKLFQDQESKAEERQLFDKLKINGSVLDVGCGTGLFLEYVKPSEYLGIDSSSRMLWHLKKKFPVYKKNTLCLDFENFYWPEYGKGWDTIVSLFGSCNYIKPEALKRIPKMLNAGGRAYLMFYAPDYFPITHTLTGLDAHIYRPKVEGEKFTNYIIWNYAKAM